MNVTQVDALARRSAVQRAGLWGRVAQYGARTFQMVVTGVTSRKQLVEAGFLQEHDAMGRVVTDGPHGFSLGGKVVYGGRTFRIDEVVEHGVNPEVRLGLRQL